MRAIYSVATPANVALQYSVQSSRDHRHNEIFMELLERNGRIEASLLSA